MIAEIIAGVVKGLYDIVKNIIRSEKPESIQDHITKNAYIQRNLESLIQSVSAGRGYITQFHNGGYFYSGNPMQKFSCTYEAVNSWVNPIIDQLQNRLVSEYPAIHSALLSLGEYYIPDVSQLTDNATRQKFTDRGVCTFYSAGIWDISGNKIGNVSVNYVATVHNMTPEEKQKVKEFAHQIGGYIIQTESNRDTVVAKVIMWFFGLMLASQTIYFLNNFVQLIHNFGPMITNIIKSLIDFL
jgi:hypothetical protein